MKKSLFGLYILAILMMSCGRQKFAFRKTVKVKHSEQVVTENTKIIASIESISDDTAKVRMSDRLVIPNHQFTEGASLEKAITPLSVEKEWKQSTHQIKKPRAESKADSEEYEKRWTSTSKWAIIGVILGIAGLFSASFLWILLLGAAAIICSLIGTTSPSFKWLAIVGLVIGALDLLLLVLGIAF